MNKKLTFGMSLLAAIFLLLSTGFSVHGQNSKTIYNVDITTGSNSICVGQKTFVDVAYRVNQGQEETKEPSATVSATNGTVAKEGAFPGAGYGQWGAGVFNFSFTATTPGTATIVAMINQGDGSATTTIKVLEECKYDYKLVVTLHVRGSDGGIVLEWEDVYTSEGSIVLDTTGSFGTAWDRAATLKRTMKILDMLFPKNDACNVPATVWTHTGGTGKVDVIGTIPSTGDSFNIRFRYPNVESTDSFSTPCKDGPISKDMDTGFVAPDLDPWVEEDFAPSGGTRQIKIDKFEEAVKLLNGSPGTVAYYFAVLTVTRVK